MSIRTSTPSIRSSTPSDSDESIYCSLLTRLNNCKIQLDSFSDLPQYKIFGSTQSLHVHFEPVTAQASTSTLLSSTNSTSSRHSCRCLKCLIMKRKATSDVAKLNAKRARAALMTVTESRKNGLKEIWRSLKQAVLSNPHDEWEEHEEIQDELTCKINNWQGQIFREFIEKGEGLREAYDDLMTLDKYICRMKHNRAGTRNVYDHSYDNMIVRDAAGKKVLGGHIVRIQMMLLKATALKAIVKGDQATVNAIVEQFKEDGNVVEQLFIEVDDDRYFLEDWYNGDAEMVDADDELKRLLDFE